MRSTWRGIVFVVGVGAAGFAGCAQAPDAGEAPEEPGAAPGETITSTVVVVGPDGPQVVSTETLTLAQLKQERAERARQLDAPAPKPSGDVLYAVTQANCGDIRTLWLFDQPNFTGNRICLFRANRDDVIDAVDLSSIPRPPVFQRHWGAAVRSFSAGSEPGYFRLAQSPYTTELFIARHEPFSVSSTVANSFVVAITAPVTDKPVFFRGYLFDQPSCPAQRVNIFDGVQNSTTTVNAAIVRPRGGNRFDCLYMREGFLQYGRNTTVTLLAGPVPSCTVRALEKSLLHVPSEWWPAPGTGVVSYHQGGCFNTVPF